MHIIAVTHVFVPREIARKIEDKIQTIDGGATFTALHRVDSTIEGWVENESANGESGTPARKRLDGSIMQMLNEQFPNFQWGKS